MSARKLLVGTRKGLLTFRDGKRGWRLRRTAHLGNPVEYAMADPRHGTQWIAIDHGHWGEKLHRSEDDGESWTEVALPRFAEGEKVFLPFAPGSEKTKPATLENVWVIAAGGADEPDRLYLGTNPGALFVSDDRGQSFSLNRALWDEPSRLDGGWFGGGRDTPGIHSICIDPRDSRHVHVGVSCAGVFETRDGGQSWIPRNGGLKAPFLPDPDAQVGHDPHCIMRCAGKPDTLWQQNHVGVYVSHDGGAQWQDVSQDGGPVGFGFPIAAHRRRRNTAWVVPGVSDQQRMAIDGALRVCRTENGGKTWQEFGKGLPQKHAYDVVFRHALDIDGDALAFGSTTGNLYLSEDGGESWRCLGNHLPPIYSVRFA
jgi:photosystem II stability/assembly factor-like uncharacterized protein